jgi:hypothetical protein
MLPFYQLSIGVPGIKTRCLSLFQLLKSRFEYYLPEVLKELYHFDIYWA